MQQLSEMDSNFLQQESVSTPMHISPVVIYDQHGRKGGKVKFKDVLTVFENNLHKSTIFRRKLAGGAMGLDTPYWVEDPTQWQVWSQAYLHNLKRPVKFVKTVRRLVPAIMRANKQSEADDDGLKAPSVHTRFNGRVDSSRVTDAIFMDLADIKRIRQACDGSTINDVIIAIIGGGLRKYLKDKEELPEESLACSAPISMRKEHGSDSSGNQVSQMTISMATDIEDPLERLRAVHHSADQGKAYSEALGTSVLMDVSEVMIPQVLGWAMRTASFAAANTSMPMPSHVVISNVPGPQQPLYLAGAKVHLLMGLGPLLHMMGLFHAVLSGAGRITINFVSCRSMLPDPEFYRECLQQSFDELMSAAAPAKKPAKTRRKSRRKTSK